MNHARAAHRRVLVGVVLSGVIGVSGVLIGVIGVLSGVIGVIGGVLSVLSGVIGVIFVVLSGVIGVIGDIGDVLVRERWQAMRSSRQGGRSGGSGLAQPAWRRPQAAEGDAGRRLLVCLTVDGLVNHLLDRAARQLPQAYRDRFAEEWQDHRTHLHGLRLVWWALCARATAFRTGHELRRVELPRIEGS
jgi:hypothetical protein